MNRFERMPSASEIEPQDNKLEKDVDRIQGALDLSQEDFENRTTLDLGSGDSSLARKYNNKESTQIVSLDLREEALVGAPDAVRADAAELPFHDESFDLVISMGGPAGILDDREVVSNIFRELDRVLKQDGEIRLGRGYLNASIFEDAPKNATLPEIKKHFKQKSKKFIEDFGFKVEEVQKGEDISDFYYRIRKKQESE